MDAKLLSKTLYLPKGGSRWFTRVYLGIDTEADEVILGNGNGVFKVQIVKRKPPSQQWNAAGVVKSAKTRGKERVPPHKTCWRMIAPTVLPHGLTTTRLRRVLRRPGNVPGLILMLLRVSLGESN